METAILTFQDQKFVRIGPFYNNQFNIPDSFLFIIILHVLSMNFSSLHYSFTIVTHTHTHTHIWDVYTQFTTNTICSFITLEDSIACGQYNENSGLLVHGVESLNVLFLKFWRTTVASESQEPPTQQHTVTSRRPACSAMLLWQPKIWSF
jgi:hypothetical protein